MDNTCAICDYQCRSDDYCPGCESYICGKHVHTPGPGPHQPTDHTADADGRVPEA